MRVCIIFFQILIMTFSAPASAQEMAPIDKFIEQNAAAENGGTEVFVGLRCSTLFVLMEQYMLENKMNEYAEKFKKASRGALVFALENQKPVNESYISNQMQTMLTAYKDRFLKAKALTGNFSDDPVIAADIKTCSDIF